MKALPIEFVREIEKMLGNDAPAFFASLDAAPALALRVNALRDGAESAALPFIEARVPWAENGYYIRPETRPGASIAHAAGAFYLQEASAMVSVAALSPRPGMRILDLCAAPGGKSTQIASAMRGEGLLICNEPEPARAKVLASNLERMGVRNACVTCAYPDALAAKWPAYFDAVLCDAPCSGEGMFRRDPSSRDEWTPASPAGCARRQAEILDSAAALVAPGGTLVYSTCTFNRAENENSIYAFLDRHPEFTPEDFSLNGLGSSKNGMLRIFPHLVRGDGHFCARLRKEGIPEAPDMPEVPVNKEVLSLIEQLRKEVCGLPELAGSFERTGDTLIALPKACPDLHGLRIVSRGLPLLRIGRNYIEPAHPLAKAIDASYAKQAMALTDDLARSYLAGETLPCPDTFKGWTLITWENQPLGWGKASSGQMKNHLPKGLRLRLHANPEE